MSRFSSPLRGESNEGRSIALDIAETRILQQSLSHTHDSQQQAKRGRRLLIEAVVLTEAVVGFAVRRRMVESASTVVLAERTIPIIFRLHPLPPRSSRRAPRRRSWRDFPPPPPPAPLRNSSRSSSQRSSRPVENSQRDGGAVAEQATRRARAAGDEEHRVHTHNVATS